MAVDPLGRDHAADLVHRVLHGPVHGNRLVPAGHPLQLGQGRREVRGAPATVAAGGTEPGDLPLADRLKFIRAAPPIRSSLARDAGKYAEPQPPLRPEAPNPAISRSQTAMRSPGLALAR